MRYKATGNGGQAGGARLRELQLAGGAERAQQRGVASEEDEQARGHALHQRARHRRRTRGRGRAELVQVLRPGARRAVVRFRVKLMIRVRARAGASRCL